MAFEKEKEKQDRINWKLANDVANHWRRMMGVREVNYPYPGSPDKVLRSYAA